MDLLEAKSRIAEALVESIFRRARYQIRPYRSDAFPLRFGREDFSPDFCVAPAPETGTGQELLVEVKYRPSAYQFLSVENQRGDRSVFLMARRNWPNLYFVLVTDRHDWSTAEIIRAYHGQSAVEALFAHLKDPVHLALRPQHHWTDQKLHVHVFTCVLGLLLASLLHLRARRAGAPPSPARADARPRRHPPRAGRARSSCPPADC